MSPMSPMSSFTATAGNMAARSTGWTRTGSPACPGENAARGAPAANPPAEEPPPPEGPRPPAMHRTRGTRRSAAYEEARAEIRRELDEGELGPLSERDPYPPSHYDRS